MGKICGDALNAFKLPVCMNIYLTGAGQRISAPLHTDKQDVLVLQTQGRKHWRVFAPPQPSRMYRADPFARGKHPDILSRVELEEPLIDTVLEAGQMLYVPTGFPHTTSTAIDGNPLSTAIDPSSSSLHMTVGIDSLIWGLTYAHLRSICYQFAGIKDKVILEKLPSDLYFELQVIHSALFPSLISSIDL
jgi:hypothetical protein